MNESEHWEPGQLSKLALGLVFGDVQHALRQHCVGGIQEWQEEIGKGDRILVGVTVHESLLFDRKAVIGLYGVVIKSDGESIVAVFRNALLDYRQGPRTHAEASGTTGGKAMRIHRSWVARVLTTSEFARAASMNWPPPEKFLRSLQRSPTT